MRGPGRNRLFGALAATLVAASALPALAQVSLEEPLDEHAAKRLDRMEKAMKELRAIVFQGRETGAPVVVQPAETQGEIAAQGDKINDINQTIARLNGELEVIKHDLDQARRDSADLRAANATLTGQVVALEKAVKDLTPPPAPPAPPAPVPPPDPAGAFAAARARLEAGDTAGAEAAFRDYIDHFGDGPQGPEARYYLARTLIARQAWPDAATAEIGAIRGWPHTRWAPDAVLGLSRALVAMGKSADACQTLSELTRRYPGATAAVRKSAAAVRAEAQCD